MGKTVVENLEISKSYNSRRIVIYTKISSICWLADAHLQYAAYKTVLLLNSAFGLYFSSFMLLSFVPAELYRLD